MANATLLPNVFSKHSLKIPTGVVDLWMFEIGLPIYQRMEVRSGVPENKFKLGFGNIFFRPFGHGTTTLCKRPVEHQCLFRCTADARQPH